MNGTFKIYSGQLSKNVPLLSVMAHNSETSGWNCIKFGSQGDIEILYRFSHFDLGFTSRDFYVTLTLFGVNGRYPKGGSD